MVLAGEIGQSLVLIAKPCRLRLEGLGLMGSRLGRLQVALDIAPHRQDDLGLALIGHRISSLETQEREGTTPLTVA